MESADGVYLPSAHQIVHQARVGEESLAFAERVFDKQRLPIETLLRERMEILHAGESGFRKLLPAKEESMLRDQVNVPRKEIP